jgi:periplasmic protein TonB
MSVAEITPVPRTEAVRWAVCFAVVAVLHVVAAVALIHEFAEPVDESGIDTPAVMLDLPQALAPAPVQDKPPGPMEDEETLPTPPPKEETKPPETEAEVALPEPKPPEQQPEPPREIKQAAAPQAARTPPPSVVRWQSQLAAHIERFKRYPQGARSQGVARVSFTIDHAGRLLHSSIVQSSGSEVLDQEALAMLARAQPMPRPPDQLTDADLTFVVPVNFLR